MKVKCPTRSGPRDGSPLVGIKSSWTPDVRRLATTLRGVGGTGIFAAALAAAATQPIVDYTIQLDVVREGFDGVHCWVHPRAGIVPNPQGGPPAVVLTLQQLWLEGSDVFGPLNEMRTDDLGRTWRGPSEHAATLGRRPEPNGVSVGVCDFWPKWHAASGKLLGIGHTVRYQNNAVMRERARETYFSIYDPAARTWTPWQVVGMPAEARPPMRIIPPENPWGANNRVYTARIRFKF